MFDVLSQSIRRWSRRPLTTIAIIGTLACGIGFATAIYSLLESLLWRPMTSFGKPEELTFIQHELNPTWVQQGGARFQPLALEDFRLVQQEVGAFSHVAATQFIRILWRSEKETRRLDGEMVSPGYFELAGIPLALGRPFTAEEDRSPGGSPIVILADTFWREAFAADRNVLGRQIELNRHTFTIIGVAAPGFTGSNRLNPADLWVPLMMYPQVFVAPQVVSRRDGRFLRVFARLKSGTLPAVAEGELKVLAKRLAAELPASHGHLGFMVRPLVGGPPSAFQQGLQRGGGLLLAIALALLLISGANIANLLATRARSRQGEMALRLALGASRRRLMRVELGDVMLLTTTGVLLGLGLALIFRRVLWALRPPYLDAQILAGGFSLKAFAFAIAAALGVALLFSLAPLLHLRAVELTALMRGDAAATPNRSRLGLWLSRQALVIGQVALATGVLSIAGLFLAHLLESRRLDPGFATQDLVLASFELQNDGLPPARIAAFQQELLARASTLPGTLSAALAENRVLGGFRLWRTIAPHGSGSPGSTVGSGAVDPAFHETVGIAVLAGRTFRPEDAAGPPVAVLNSVLAKQLFGDEKAALGRQLVVDDAATPFEIVGVVANADLMALGEENKPFLYLPLSQFPSQHFTLHVRTRQAEGALPLLRTLIAQIDGHIPIESLATVEHTLEEALWLQRLSTSLLVLLGLVGLILAGIGVYSVAGVETARREREIGVRLALGATKRQIATDVLRRGLTAVGLGVTAGIVLCLLSLGFLRGLLYDIGQIPWTLIVGVVVLLATVACLAHLFPVLKATAIDPARTLREG